MIEKNVPLKELTTIKIGGTARYMAKPTGEENLVEYVKRFVDEGISIYILGRGSNTIFGDFHGAVISTRYLKGFYVRELDDGFYVRADCGVQTWELVKLALHENLQEVYKLVGFPATIGGAIAMNAGAYGYEVSNSLVNVKFLGWDGKVYIASKEELEFSYRSSPFPEKGIVLGAEFVFRRSKTDIREEYERIRKRRLQTQPINMPTSGSTFKNPRSDYAGRLLELVGMKGYRKGDLSFSELHANFLVNLGNATIEDVIELLQEAKKRVYESFGIELEEEVRIVESGSFDGWKVA